MYGLLVLIGKGYLSDEVVLIGLYGIYVNELEVIIKKVLLYEAFENKVLKFVN